MNAPNGCMSPAKADLQNLPGTPLNPLAAGLQCRCLAQRPLWASTGAQSSNASDFQHVESLAASFTVNTMPQGMLNLLAERGPAQTWPLPSLRLASRLRTNR